MEYIYLIAGFILLLYGGKLLVRGGVALADKFNIHPLVIGLTIVSFGTSAPELFVSVIAGIRNHTDVAIGNVIGSNIANIALVLALTAIIFPLPVRSSSVKVDAPFMLIVSVLLWIFMYNLRLSRFEGIIFLVLITAYTIAIFYWSKKNKIEDKKPGTIEKLKIWRIILILILSYAGLAVGSELLVKNASIIALKFGVDERVIAVSIVAFGTSLPELVTSVLAAFKKEMDISIGNIIGSNIFNILVVLGTTSVVKPLIDINPGFLSADIFWMLGTSILLFLFILPFKGGKLTRWKGIILSCIYFLYVFILYFR